MELEHLEGAEVGKIGNLFVFIFIIHYLFNFSKN